MSPNLSILALLPKNAYFLSVGANLPPRLISSLLLLIQPLAIGLQCLQNPICAQHYDDSRLSILAQSRSSFNLSALEATFIKISNPALFRKKRICVQLKDLALMTLSHWSFFSQSRLVFFLQIAASFPVLSILTIFDMCQTKCFENINILIKTVTIIKV